MAFSPSAIGRRSPRRYAAQLLGLAGATRPTPLAARDKRLTRERLRSAGLPTPWFMIARRTHAGRRASRRRRWPVVVKPAVLSGSRGVMRADDAESSSSPRSRACQRCSMLADVRALQDPAADDILIEQFIQGREYALEGIVARGRLHDARDLRQARSARRPVLRGDDLRHAVARVAALRSDAIDDAQSLRRSQALGLRSWSRARRVPRQRARRVRAGSGGAADWRAVCAGAAVRRHRRASRSDSRSCCCGTRFGERRRRWAASRRLWRDDDSDSGGRDLSGRRRRRARRAACRMSCDVQITAKPDQQLVPLPEGASYLGFIFARADDPEASSRRCATRTGSWRSIDRAIVVNELPTVAVASSRIDETFFRRGERAQPFDLLRDVARRQRRALAEEEILHLLQDQLLRLFLPRHQAVLVEDHLLPFLPELPRLRRDLLVDPLADFARPGWRVESGSSFWNLTQNTLRPALIARRLGVDAGRPAAHAHIVIVAATSSDASRMLASTMGDDPTA